VSAYNSATLTEDRVDRSDNRASVARPDYFVFPGEI
jgi:hypothetical protein